MNSGDRFEPAPGTQMCPLFTILLLDVLRYRKDTLRLARYYITSGLCPLSIRSAVSFGRLGDWGRLLRALVHCESCPLPSDERRER